MESHSKSFHLQTPFVFGGGSFSTERTTGISRGRQGNKSFLSSEGATSVPEGTFSDVVEYNKHLLALKDLQELKDQYYDEYLENLEKKVLKQRKEFAKKEEEIQKFKDEENQKVSLPKLKKLPHHRLKHDKEYMRKVTKSRFYHLLAARDLMRQKGLLKFQSDEDSFWNRVLHDSDIWNHPVPNNVPSHTVTQVMFNRFTSMSRLQKVTQKRDRQRVAFSESPSKSFQVDSSLADGTSRNYFQGSKIKEFKVKMKLPKLHSLKNTSPLPAIEPKPSTITDSDYKLKRLEKSRSVQRAYDVAMVNHAMMRQMLKRHELSTEKKTTFFPGDVVAATNVTQSIPSHSNERAKLPLSQGNESQVFITEPVYGNDQVLIPELEYKYPSGQNALKRFTNEDYPDSKQSRLKDAPAEDATVVDEALKNGQNADVSLPLSYAMMLGQGDLKVKEAKPTRSMWVNYIVDEESS